jgi:hypothetical protein
MMCPLRCSRITGIAAFVTMMVPKRFVSICSLKSSNAVSSTELTLPYPALLTRTSSPPKLSTATRTAASAAA